MFLGLTIFLFGIGLSLSLGIYLIVYAQVRESHNLQLRSDRGSSRMTEKDFQEEGKYTGARARPSEYVSDLVAPYSGVFAFTVDAKFVAYATNITEMRELLDKRNIKPSNVYLVFGKQSDPAKAFVSVTPEEYFKVVGRSCTKEEV